MKKIIIFIILTTQTIVQVSACDACGCGLGGYYFGILPQFQSHFIGMRYTFNQFNAFIDNTYAADERSTDTFTRLEVMGRYTLSQKFQLYFSLPYQRNEMNGNLQQVTSSGLGDPLLLGYFTPINTGDQLSMWRHSLRMGAGVKFPFGAHQAMDNNEILNRNFQLGTGSMDYLISTNYTLRRMKQGMTIESTYKMNSANSMDYRFGNQFNISTNFFQLINTKSVMFLPLAGLYYEVSAPHQQRGIKQSNTGGDALLLNLGVQVFSGNFTIHFTFQKPLAQDYSTDPITTIDGGNRIMTGLIYNFSFGKKNQIEVSE